MDHLIIKYIFSSDFNKYTMQYITRLGECKSKRNDAVNDECTNESLFMDYDEEES